MLDFVNNFEQYFESCIRNSQNPFKGAPNKVNGPSLRKIKLSKFSVVSLFLNALARNKTPEKPEINKRHSKLQNMNG